MSLTPGSRFGAYEIVAPLGAGAMGEVWRARDTRLSREVALKVIPGSLAMDRERLQRFEREAQVLASLNHPNIASIYGVEESNGAMALVLELVEGPTLDERIGQGALPPDEAVTIARQIAEALEYAHERGVVHRDLKPANVKLAADGRVKVLDFGLAKAIAPDSAGRSDSAISPTITSLGTIAGVILGTAAYMAPEQARGTNVDRRADIWSFGAVLWEMLTGKRLFDDATVSDTLAAVLRAPIEWGQLPPSVPRGVVRLLKRCLERDPKKRLRDIGEARIALETLATDDDVDPTRSRADGHGDGSRISDGNPAAVPWRARVAWALAVIVVALSAVAIVGFWRRPAMEQPVVRFQLPVPDAMTAMGWPRLSPDGTMIAFSGRGASGKNTIWVRRLDAFEAQELPGTEGASRHWWSPDSRHIAAFIGNQLKKFPAAGGPAQLIGEADGGADGSWGSAGTILFDGRAIDPIRRIEAGGGKPVQATTPDASKGEAGHSWPFFLPDGKRFLFLGMAKSPNEKATIRVGTLGSTESKALTPTSSRVEYANGYLVYVLDGTLVAHKFDPDSLALSGEPVPIGERIVTDANGSAAFSLSTNGELAYLSGTSGGDSELVWIDRAGREIAKIGEPGPYRDLALSPDGTRLAYGIASARDGTEDLWVRDLKREVASRFTFGPKNEVWPVWSPDGRRLAYSSDANGTFTPFVKDANGAGTEASLGVDPSGGTAAIDWSRDGRWIAVDVLPPSRRWQIKLLPAQGEPKLADYLVADVMQTMPRFSPDGRFMAYTSNESGVREAYVQTIPTGGGKWQISSGGADSIVWSADGKELFYKTLADEFIAVPVSTGARFEPGMPKPLFKRAIDRGGIVGMRWAVSGDGQRFLVNAARDTRGLPFAVVLNWPAALK